MNGNFWLGQPCAFAFGASRRLAQFFRAEFKTAFAAGRRLDARLEFAMFQTAKQMRQIFLDSFWRLIHLARDLRDRHRIIFQQWN